MIKNEREYKITKASLTKFKQALTVLSKLQEKTPKDSAKLKLQEAATKSMIGDLQAQIRAYEKLRAGRFDVGALDMVEGIPNSLICARIALGWTQKDLARQLGTTEQQIQKYEATDYESASFRKISEIVSVLKAAFKPRRGKTA